MPSPTITITSPAPALTTDQQTTLVGYANTTATNNGWTGGFTGAHMADLISQINEHCRSDLAQLWLLEMLNRLGE